MGDKPGCLGFLFGKKEHEDAVLLPYRVREDFLSEAELSFYSVLETAAGDLFAICPKVNLQDIFYVDRPRDKMSGPNRMIYRNVDFLLCEKETMKPLLGVELEEDSQQPAEIRERDLFVEDVFDVAKLPLARIFAAETYDPADLRSYLCDAAGMADSEGRTSAPAGEAEQAEPSGESRETGPAEEPPLPYRPELLQREDEAPEAAPPESRPVDRGEETPGTERAVPARLPEKREETPVAEPVASRPAPREAPPGTEQDDASVSAGGEPPASAAAGAAPDRQEEKPAKRAPFAPAKHDFGRASREVAAAASTGSVPACPQCAVPMVLRTSKRGIEFYHCPNFPRCREVRGIYE